MPWSGACIYNGKHLLLSSDIFSRLKLEIFKLSYKKFYYDIGRDSFLITNAILNSYLYIILIKQTICMFKIFISH